MRLNAVAVSPVALLMLACGGSDPKTKHTAPEAEITEFKVEPTTLPLGGKATLTAAFREGVPRIEGLTEADKEIKPGVFELTPEKTTTYTLTVTNAVGKATPPRTVTVTVIPPDATITAPKSVGPNQAGCTAKVPDQFPDAKCTYAWSISSGQITSETNTPEITFTAPGSGIVTLTCTVTNTFGKWDTKEVQIPVESSLDVDIVGLPKGVASDVILHHPDGRTEVIQDDFKLKNPVPGTYTVTAKTVLHQGLTFHPWQPEQKFTIAPNAAVAAKVQYPLPMYVAMIPDASDPKKQNKVPMEFVLVPAGEFYMGSKTFGPPHKVSFKTAFYMARTECTQEQWQAILSTSKPSTFQTPGTDETEAHILKRPVETVSWSDVNQFLRELNLKSLGPVFHLPSEAQWEYAYKAQQTIGTTSEYFLGLNADTLKDYSWNGDNSGVTTHPVATKMPNPWGICDIVGNVWEWCDDEWHGTYDGAPEDGSAWKSPGVTAHTIRGGNYSQDAEKLQVYTSAFRKSWPDEKNSGIGFRLVINEPQFENKDVRHGFGDADVHYWPGDLIAVDPTKTYRLTVDVLAWPKAPGARIYLGVTEYDKDQNIITCINHMQYKALDTMGTPDKADDVYRETTTRLKNALKFGDREVVLEDATWWAERTDPWRGGFIFWDWADSAGKPYPVGAYSRDVVYNCWQENPPPINKTTHTIYLKDEWRNYSNKEFPAGTFVSQCYSDYTYRYCTAVGVDTPSRWVKYPLPDDPHKGQIGGIDEPNGNNMNKFTAATRYVRPFFLGGYSKITGETVYFCNWKFEEVK